MKSLQQVHASLERFRTAFWDRRITDRPPVAVFNDRLLLPIHYLKTALPGNPILPEHVRMEHIYSDYDFDDLTRRVYSDDWLPFSAAWRAVPWLEAICGCPVRYSSGSLAAQPFLEDSKMAGDEPLRLCSDWLSILADQTSRLVLTSPDDCWVSPSILRGPSDVLAAMRGLESFMCDLFDRPSRVETFAAAINDLLGRVLMDHFALVNPKLGGYGHIYGYWAPDKTFVLQEDIMGLAGSSFYRQYFFRLNQALVKQMGGCVFFHMHSTGLQHYQDVLQIRDLAGIQLTVEAKGPHLTDLVPVLQNILHHSRLILFVDGFFNELDYVLNSIPLDGLYLLVSDKFVKSENEFERLVIRLWPKA
jgi:hypothetical protein